MGEIALEDCTVPLDYRLGREGRGAEVFNASMEWKRGAVLASALGTMRRQLERAIEHARTRKEFGKPIGKFQAVAHRRVGGYALQVDWADGHNDGLYSFETLRRLGAEGSGGA